MKAKKRLYKLTDGLEDFKRFDEYTKSIFKEMTEAEAKEANEAAMSATDGNVYWERDK